MKRLTVDGSFCSVTQCEAALVCKGHCAAYEMYERLKQYEDMEEAGRLLKLRVGIGDIVYTIMDGKILPMEIQYIYVSSKGRIRYHAAEAVYEKNFREPAFGRDVFVSREAAERKLKEARDG